MRRRSVRVRHNAVKGILPVRKSQKRPGESFGKTPGSPNAIVCRIDRIPEISRGRN